MATAAEISNDESKDVPLQLVHEILVLDAFLTAPLDDRRFQTITRDFVRDMLRELGMEPLGELGIYPAVDLREPGWSFIQPITTSHVSAHYFENPGSRPHIRLDAYSCATINWTTLLAVCDKHLRLADWFGCFIERQLDKPHRRRVVELAGKGRTVVSKNSLGSQPLDIRGARQ
jgi:hypothetical protein